MSYWIIKLQFGLRIVEQLKRHQKLFIAHH